MNRIKSWFGCNIFVIFSLSAYFYLMWDFLIGRVFFSSDFCQLHILFELVYKSLNKDFSFPTWLPLFQGGKGIFGDMAYSYFPYGIDSIVGYLILKLAGLHDAVGLVLIDTWRLVLLSVFFAFGCRQFAREFVKFRYSADFTFLICLFVNSFFLSHRPNFVISNIFSPWILLYMTRIFTKFPERWLHNLTGLMLATAGGLFHQFSNQSTTVWFFIFFYLISLLYFFPRRFIQVFISWKGRIGLSIFFIIAIMSFLPSILGDRYFKEYNRRLLDTVETIQDAKNETLYNFDDFVYERFEFQKLLSFIFPYPGTLEKVTDVDVRYGMPGMFVHNFQYYGILAAIIIMIALIFGKNYYRYPVIFGIVLFLLFCTINRSPFFLTAWRLHYPMSRHFLFIPLHLAPLLAVLAGIGMDEVLIMRLTRKANFVFGVVISEFVLLVSLFISYLMLKDSLFSTAYQGYLYSIFFISLALIGVFGVLQFNRYILRFRVLFLIAIIDLITFNHIAKAYIINTGRNDTPLIFTQSINYDKVLPGLPVLDNFYLFSDLPPEVYAVHTRPSYCFPKLFKYGVIGNKSFYDVMMNTTAKVRNMISGFALPRIFVADAAVEDPEGVFTRKILSSDLAERIVSNVVFLNGSVKKDKDTLLDLENLSKYEQVPKVLAREEINFYNISPSMISSNIPIENGSVAYIFDNDMSTLFEPDVYNMPRDGKLWIEFDFGNETVINLVRVFIVKDTDQYPWSISFLEGSHDGKVWETVGYLTRLDSQRNSATAIEWQCANDDTFRYYRIIGDISSDLQHISKIELGSKTRRIISGIVDRYVKKVSLIRFKKEGFSSDKKYYLLSYILPSSSGVDISTNPTQRFAFTYDISLNSQNGKIQLKPTWNENWHSDNLFQIGYVVNGKLIINIPRSKLKEFHKSIIDIAIGAPDIGVDILDYGADSLVLTVDRSKPGWLYYADTWDKYWTAIVNGNISKVYKANLQFKSVYIPEGKSIVRLSHRNKLYSRIIYLNYILQFIIFLIWIKTRRAVIR